jgi:hypothetical protein
MLVYKQWKGSDYKQSARWQHVSQLKAGAFCFFGKINCGGLKQKQLILGTGAAIWWETEPHCLRFLRHTVN